jgi:hypothetical protein
MDIEEVDGKEDFIHNIPNDFVIFAEVDAVLKKRRD